MSVIGIDLGTTYSSVAVWRNGNVEVIENDAGNKLTPSYVAFTSTERLIGDSAKDQAGLNPQNTVYNIKRLVGRRFADEEAQIDRLRRTYQVVEENNLLKIMVEYKGIQKALAPEEVTAMILSKMKDIAETYLDTKVVAAVVTVPTYFTNSQRQSTIDAGKIAGLQVNLINEPTAAAVAYGLEKKAEGNILVYNLGGGNCDVSIVNITKDRSFEVVATSGDIHLGGDDFDYRLVGRFVEEIKEKYNINVSQSKRIFLRLHKEAEKIKRMLSSGPQALVSIDSLIEDFNFETIVTRDEFENWCEDLFNRAMKPVESVLRNAKMKITDIRDVVLVGGSSRIPRVQLMLQKLFKGKLLTLNMNADEAATYGAAAVAACHKKEIIREVNPFPLYASCGAKREMQIFEPNWSIPASTNFNIEYASRITVLEWLSSESSNVVCEYIIETRRQGTLIMNEMELTFKIDSNGVFSAEFNDGENYIVRKISVNLLNSEINEMIEEAMRFKKDDVENIKAVNARNELEKYVFEIKRELASQTFLNFETSKQQLLSRCDEIIDGIDMDDLKSKKEYEVIKEDLQNRYESLKVRQNAQIARNDLEKYVYNMKNKSDFMLSEKSQSKLKSSCNEALIWINSEELRSYEDYEAKKNELLKLEENLKEEATNNALSARKTLEIYVTDLRFNVDPFWGETRISKFIAACDDVLSPIKSENLRPERYYERLRVQLENNLHIIKDEAKLADSARSELMNYANHLLNYSDTMLSKELKSGLNASCSEVLKLVEDERYLKSEEDYMAKVHQLQKILESLKDKAIHNAWNARDKLENDARQALNNPGFKLSRDSKDELKSYCNEIIQWLNTHDLRNQEEYERMNQKLRDFIYGLRTSRKKSKEEDDLMIGGNRNKEMASKLKPFYTKLQSMVYKLQNEVKKSKISEPEKNEILGGLDQVLNISENQTIEMIQENMKKVSKSEKCFKKQKPHGQTWLQAILSFFS